MSARTCQFGRVNRDQLERITGERSFAALARPTKQKFQRMKKIILSTILILAFTVPIRAVEPEPVFKAGEFALDAFGTYTDARPHGLNGSLRHGNYGAGIAATYFFHVNAGLQFDSTTADVTDITGKLIDHSSLSLIVRYPVGRLAPYVAAGGGRNWEDESFDTHVGVGAEYRLSKNLGAIGEARWIFGTQAAPDALQFRAGLRYTF